MEIFDFHRRQKIPAFITKNHIQMQNTRTEEKEDTKLTANVIGATGLVGKQLVNLLLDDSHFTKVRIFVRRNLSISHPKLEQKIVDFRNTKTWESQLKGDVLFSALGTTLKKAGSKEKQYEVDFRYNLSFANKAKQNGISNYILVSAVGASSKSKIFYNRMKGELDDAVLNLNFRNLSILRASALEGERDETRWLESISIPIVKLVTRFVFKKFRPIKDITVARAMINASLKPINGKSIWTADEIFELAKQ